MTSGLAVLRSAPGFALQWRPDRRDLLLSSTLLVAAGAGGATRLFGAAGSVVPSVLVAAALVAAVALLLALAGRTPHPTGWRWYAGSLAMGGTASLLTVAPPALNGIGMLADILAQLLTGVAVALMIDRGTWRTDRLQRLTSMALFVVATLLTVRAVMVILAEYLHHPEMVATVAPHALSVILALSTGAALLLLVAGGPAQRPVATLVLLGQCLSAGAAVLAMLTSSTHHPEVHAFLWPTAVLSVGVVALACLRDRPGRPGSSAAPADGSALSALLPHVMAMIGGALLLVSIAVTGRLDPLGVAVGGAGLAVLVAHQAATWRTQRRLTTDLQRSEAYFRTLVRSSADPILILDEQLLISWVSPSIVDLLGIDPAHAVGQPVTRSVHPDDAEGLLTALRAPPPGTARPGGAGTESTVRTVRVQHGDGRWRLIETTIRDLRVDPDIGALVLYCRDVTAATRAPDDGEAAELPTIDPASGLPNRAALTQRLGSRLRSGGGAHPTALVLLGVTGLTEAATLGPDAESQALRELTARLARALRGKDWLARAGGGDFVVLVEGSIADAETVAARLVATVTPLSVPAGLVRLTAVAGVTALDGDLDSGEALRRGNLALTSARGQGPGRVRRYDEALRLTQDRRDTLRADLGEALQMGEFRLVFQPVVDLVLHRTVSVEALLRWRHPQFGEVSPGEFIPLAEESSLITDVGRWVLVEACATIAALPSQALTVAVNISARHVRSGELIADVLSALDQTGLPAHRLVLEITESLLMDDPHVIGDLAALRDLGVRIAIDDFGTGWSSLAYLVGMPIDVLKMDRQFLANVEHDAQRRALCRSVLHLGTSLGLAVVVEGVETSAELTLLRDMGHRFVQGFLLARPMEADLLARRDCPVGPELHAVPAVSA